MVTPRDLLLYHYYAGMVEVGSKRFKAASQYLTLAFSAPSQVLNAIMVEAYKKCVLCTLIDAGVTAVRFDPPAPPLKPAHEFVASDATSSSTFESLWRQLLHIRIPVATAPPPVNPVNPCGDRRRLACPSTLRP